MPGSIPGTGIHLLTKVPALMDIIFQKRETGNKINSKLCSLLDVKYYGEKNKTRELEREVGVPKCMCVCV